jgi:hypothetical protein
MDKNQLPVIHEAKLKKKTPSPQVNYTNRATAACWQS